MPVQGITLGTTLSRLTPLSYFQSARRPRPKACFIPAQGTALGSHRQFDVAG